MTDVNAQGQVRGNARQFFTTGTQVQLVQSDGGALIITQGLPERAELVKLGASFGCAIPTGSHFTYVAALPTTRAELVLYNGEAASGPTYVIDRVWMQDDAAGPTGPRALLGQIVPIGATGPINVASGIVDNSAVLRWQLSGRGPGTSTNARLALASLICAANKWFPLGPSVFVPIAPTAAQNIGTTLEAMVQGRILIPPGAAFAIAGVAGAASGTAIAGIEWHEVYLNLG